LRQIIDPCAVTQLDDRQAAPVRARRLPHRAWWVAAVAFVTLIGAAGFRAVPSVLIDPLHDEFGWSRATISSAVSINLVLFGLFSPFAAALMDRLGMRRVVVGALILVSAGSGLTVFMNASWQLLLCWGLLVGLGTGSMAMTFVATVTSRWFVKHRGLVSGILTAAGATGQLIFLPLVAALATEHGWRTPALVVSGAALAVVPLVLLALRDFPADVGTTAYGARGDEPDQAVGPVAGGAVTRALRTLRDASRTSTFWLLAGGFAICGMSTNGLIGTHFIAAAHDHGMPHTTAASLLAIVGIFDVAGTILSGYLTDRIDSRVLLGGYYTFRGLSLLILPSLFAPDTQPSMWVFIIFYGLDWIATVPPTVALCRERWGMSGPIVFGWVFASHQVGAAIAAVGAGAIRDSLGDYRLAFYLAGALCVLAALFSISIRRQVPVTPR
jgi:MFS family permease